MKQIRALIDGSWVDGETVADVLDKYSGETVAELHFTSEAQVRRATQAVSQGFDTVRTSPYRRYEILYRAAEILDERRDEFVRTIITEAGFPVAEATKEVDRAQQTLILSAEEAKRITGHLVPVDSVPGGSDRLAFTVRHPVGVVCAITPFNSPLNTVAHKIAPALAAGNSVVLKPSSYTPITADMFARVLLDAGLPPELISVVYGEGSTVGDWLLRDPIPAFYAFTGSTAVGERIRRTIGLRRAQLELGSLSSTIVCADANLARCVPLCLNAAYRKAGQVCTSVQRLYVHEAVLDDFLGIAKDYLANRVAGDPADPATYVGPLISVKEAERIASWVDEASQDGASVVSGGTRRGTVIEPTILRDVQLSMRVMSQEVFGPVMCLRSFGELGEAIDEANATPYGLAAGIFTSSIDSALEAASRLRVGTVHINETSSSRVDLIPFGGVKASGSGHEGPRYAIKEMTEERLITLGPAGTSS